MVRQAKDIDPNPRHLTPKQMQVLTFIRDFRNATGYSPTMAEMADHLNVSKVTVFEHVTVLEVKGWLKRTKHRARSVELADKLPIPDALPEPAARLAPAQPDGLPFVGKIAAGPAIEAIEQVEKVDVNSLLKKRNTTYLLTVEGDSMIGDHICSGDLAVIEQRSDAEDGDIVVAFLADGEATLKHYYALPDGSSKLVASNPAYPDRIVEPGGLTIQGVLVGLVRQLR